MAIERPAEHDDVVVGLLNAAATAQAVADYLPLARVAGKLIAHCEASGDRDGLAWGHYFAGSAHFQRNDSRPAERSYHKALELFAELDDREGIARARLGLGEIALDCDLDGPTARALFDEAMPAIRATGDKRRLGIALGNLAEVDRLEGDGRMALNRAQEALALFREIGDASSIGWQLTNIAHLQLLRRNHAEAIATLHEAYDAFSRQATSRDLALYFDVWLIALAALGRWELAGKLLGFVNAYRDRNNAPRMQGIMPWFSRPVERLSENVASDRLSELVVEGENMKTRQIADELAAVNES